MRNHPDAQDLRAALLRLDALIVGIGVQLDE